VVSHAPVIIVGGGASGLSAAAALRQRGIESLVLERDTAIGGTWARRYDRLHLHTMREFSGLAHLSIPQRYPRYLSRLQFAEYLNEYAAHFDLRVVTGAPVSLIRPEGPDWTTETRGPEGPHNYRSRVVVVATGQYREPVVPSWPGTHLYRGRLSHSSLYSTPAGYAGLRVLVVGAGNSGAEIATDLAEGGTASVALSIRTPPPIVPRDPFGLPVQRTSLLLSLFPAAVADRLARTTARLALGDLTRYGMPSAAFTPYRRRHVPLIDVGFVAALKRAAIAVRPAVTDLTADGARFADGAVEAFDAIVAATGFATGLRGLLDVHGVLDEAGEPLAGSGETTAAPGLYFVGFVHSLRGHLFEANRASRKLAKRVERHLKS
jgi:cation diffusion facilitator CzcD-associated flavoprotein CzcO